MPGDEVDADIKWLHRLRNLLSHIRPSALLVAPADLVEMTAHCLSVIRFLLIERGDMWWLYQEERSLAEAGLSRAEAEIVRLRPLYPDD